MLNKLTIRFKVNLVLCSLLAFLIVSMCCSITEEPTQSNTLRTHNTTNTIKTQGQSSLVNTANAQSNTKTQPNQTQTNTTNNTETQPNTTNNTKTQPNTTTNDQTQTNTQSNNQTQTQQLNQNDITLIAQVLYGEARDSSTTEVSAVAWTILNRCDYFGQTIEQVILSPYQFCTTYVGSSVPQRYYDIANDVLSRYYREKTDPQATPSGRTLPSTYLYFIGDGTHNYFTQTLNSTDYYTWHLGTPYED